MHLSLPFWSVSFQKTVLYISASYLALSQKGENVNLAMTMYTSPMETVSMATNLLW